MQGYLCKKMDSVIYAEQNGDTVSKYTNKIDSNSLGGKPESTCLVCLRNWLGLTPKNVLHHFTSSRWHASADFLSFCSHEGNEKGPMLER